jgi:hypothetical protein
VKCSAAHQPFAFFAWATTLREERLAARRRARMSRSRFRAERRCGRSVSSSACPCRGTSGRAGCSRAARRRAARCGSCRSAMQQRRLSAGCSGGIEGLPASAYISSKTGNTWTARHPPASSPSAAGDRSAPPSRATSGTASRLACVRFRASSRKGKSAADHADPLGGVFQQPVSVVAPAPEGVDCARIMRPQRVRCSNVRDGARRPESDHSGGPHAA